MEQVNKLRTRPLRFGIGLHLGDVLYGNVGTPTRIEFTVIGAAPNEAARIEALCKELGVPLLISQAVAQYLSAPLRSLGPQRLRGVGESVELFTPAKKN
jgi:adenylate cyclase